MKKPVDIATNKIMIDNKETPYSRSHKQQNYMTFFTIENNININ